MSLQNKNFKNGQDVVIVGIWEDDNPGGKIVGKSTEGLVDFYIVECYSLYEIEPEYGFGYAVFPESNLETW